ncbi:MAG: FG-GAP-like repeat-containing protein [Capsulimonas sp.]|uniref:FG-GAP-like repeat-containing protein n=1 Tax=Capsulimonas sp. TaxID=2494211 RepID=UPI0032662E29
MQHSRQAGISTLLLTVASALFAASPSRALTYNVTSLADNGGAGQLRAGITAANASAGSTITFQKGLAGKIILSPTLQALPVITVGTTIQGPGASLIAVDGNGTYRPFHINSASSTVTISGLTIQHGMDSGGTGGAGILVESGSLILLNSTLANNIASGNGGAILNYGTVTLRNCTLSKNSAYNGAGVYSYTYAGSGGNAALTECIVSGNSATINGGGIYNNTYSGTGARTSLTNCTLSRNIAGNNGGGVYNYTYSGSGGLAAFKNCVLSNNSGVYGAGIYNYAYSGSGGVSTLTYCSLSGNAASAAAGGIYNYTYSGSGGRSVLTDCILYGDPGGEIFGSIAATYSDIQGGHAGAGNVNVNPQFINPGSGNLTLKFTSPCIGAGTPVPGITTDLPGQTRKTPPAMGAYEGGSGMSGHNVLAVQNAGTHQVALWTVNGATVTNVGVVSTTPLAGWNVVGVADFNDDGMNDLLFQNSETGALTAWYLNVLVITETAVFPTPAAGLKVVGVGDFNGDGKPDLAFQNQTSSAITVRFMNGAQDIGGGPTSNQTTPGWKVVGIGDYNGDGASDIQFQNGPTLVVWYMHGLAYAGGLSISVAAPAGSHVVAVTSLYGQVNPDLVFQQAAGGPVEVWEMSSVNVIHRSSLSLNPGAGGIVSGAR